MPPQRRQQQELQKTEEKYHSLFEQASDPIMITDFTGNFTDVNAAMCTLFGYTKEELLTMNIMQLVDQEQLKSTPIRFDLLAKGQHIFSNRNMLHRNGKVIQVAANVKKIDEDRVMAIARDVTELKKAEENAAAQEKQLRLFIEHSPAAIAMFDMDMRYLHVSRRWMTDYNLTGRQVIGRLHYEVFPGIPQRWKEIHQRCLAGNSEKSEEDSFVREDGSIDWLRWEIHPWYKASGGIGGIMMLTEVITSKKNTELALREAELKFRDLVEKSLAGVYIMQGGKYVYVNPRFAEIFGYEQDELIGSYPVEVVVVPADRDKVLENIRTRIDGEMDSVHYELRGLKKNGQQIWVEVFGSRTVYKGNLAIIGTLIDITERKHAAEENEHIRYMLNERVKELTTLYKFGQLLQLPQLSMRSLLQDLVDVLPPGWQYPSITAARIRFGKNEYRTANYKKTPYKQDVSFKTAGGTDVLIEVSYLEQKPDAEEGPFLSEERNLINMLAEMFRIYLARKEESEALKKSEANLHTIFDTTDSIYVLLDKKFRIISYNKPAVDFAAKELDHPMQMSDHIADYFPDERRRTLITQMKKALTGEHVNYEAVYPQQDGSNKWYDVRILPIAGSDGEIFGIILAALDITEKKLLQAEVLEQKVQEQKRISRAIIKAQEKQRNHIGVELHDNVNQILAGAKLYLSIAAQRDNAVKELVRYPMELLESCVHEIRLLSSRQVTPLKDIPLKDLIRSLLDSLKRDIKIKTRFKYDVTGSLIDDDIKLNIYRIIQEQVNNIIKYAEAKNVKASVIARNNRVRVLVSDDGVGFDINKKRTGIGISNMINRVEAFNGKLLIESSPGKGTKVDISIPLGTIPG